jgi:hypothetical protein
VTDFVRRPPNKRFDIFGFVKLRTTNDELMTVFEIRIWMEIVEKQERTKRRKTMIENHSHKSSHKWVGSNYDQISGIARITDAQFCHEAIKLAAGETSR